MTKNLYSKILLVALALTLTAVVGKHFLPKRNFILAPNPPPDINYFLLPVNNDPDNKKAFWIDRSRLHFHCAFESTDENAPCNIIFVLTQDGVHGMDLSKFDSLTLELRYKGSFNSIRIAIRDFDPRFSTLKNDNSPKFNNINLRSSDLNGELHIKMDELVVAEWWTRQMDLPREYIHPDVRNAITFAIDIAGDLRNSEHDLEIVKLEFVGDWISNENWYLFILLIWIFGGGTFTLIRLLHLQRKERAHQKKISDLVVTNSQLQHETDKFRKLSTVDSLTNAFNRHGIEQVIQSLDFSSTTTSLLLIDVDYFKKVNDQYGHDNGDLVLQTISQVIMKNCRASDNFGRWGGEEFVLICPNTEPEAAVRLAEKLRVIISNTEFGAPKKFSVTASFGVAPIQENFSSALKHADEALYQAKAAGRNCVMLADESE